MKKIVVLGILGIILVGCSSDSKGPDTLTGNWIAIDQNGNTGVAATFTADGRYVQSVISVTSQTSANVFEELGTWTHDQKSIQFNPTSTTCTNVSLTPYKNTYVLNGDDLILDDVESTVAFHRNTAKTPNSFFITKGCFTKSGGFIPTP